MVPTKSPLLTKRLYDFLKFFAQVLLPAAGTLYFALAAIWHLPVAEQVIGTITAVDAFLGIALQLNTNAYNASEAKYDGSIDLAQVDGKKIYSLNLNSDPAALDSMDQVVFKINK